MSWALTQPNKDTRKRKSYKPLSPTNLDTKSSDISSNSTMCKNNLHDNQTAFIKGMQHWMDIIKFINVIHHIPRANRNAEISPRI